MVHDSWERCSDGVERVVGAVLVPVEFESKFFEVFEPFQCVFGKQFSEVWISRVIGCVERIVEELVWCIREVDRG